MSARSSDVAPQASTRARPAAAQAKSAGLVEDLYTVVELAALWRCSRDHIYDLIAKRQLTSVHIGIGQAKTRIPASAAAAFIAKRTTKGRAA